MRRILLAAILLASAGYANAATKVANAAPKEAKAAPKDAKAEPKEAKAAPKLPPTQDAHVTNLEDRLRERLGTKVHLRYAKGKGAVEIAFFSDDELERILQLLGISPQ